MAAARGKLHGNVRKHFPSRSMRNTWLDASLVREGYEREVGLTIEAHLVLPRSPGEEETAAAEYDEQKIMYFAKCILDDAARYEVWGMRGRGRGWEWGEVG